MHQVKDTLTVYTELPFWHPPPATSRLTHCLQEQSRFCNLHYSIPSLPRCDCTLRLHSDKHRVYVCVCAELLTQASRQIMIEMVSIVFKGLADIPDVPMTPTTARSLADLAHSPRLQYSPDSAQGPLLSPFLGGGTVASTAGDSSRASQCFYIVCIGSHAMHAQRSILILCLFHQLCSPT